MAFNDPYSDKLTPLNLPSGKESVDSNSITFIGMGRVLKTILGDNEDDTDFMFGGYWRSVGAIKYELVYNTKMWDVLPLDVKLLVENKPFAYAFASGVIRYPVCGEIVMLFSGPSIELNDSKTSKTVYYMGPYSLWGNINQNAMPDLGRLQTTLTYGLPPINTVQTGPTTSNDNFNPPELYGPDFEEKHVPSLRVFNGDTIYVGRFGQSIRFGHTTSNKKFFSTWSNNSIKDNTKDSDPITIISNKVSEPKDKFQPSIEDPNKDESATWMTSTQRIPFLLREYKLKSFKVDPPEVFDQYHSPQHISIGDRVVIWGKKDYVFILGKKGVSISSPKSVNIDSKEILLNGEKVKFGLTDKEEGEPVLLGDQTVDKMTELLFAIEQFAFVLSLISETGFAQAVVQIKKQSELLNNTCKTLGEQIRRDRKGGSVIQSKVTFTK